MNLEQPQKTPVVTGFYWARWHKCCEEDQRSEGHYLAEAGEWRIVDLVRDLFDANTPIADSLLVLIPGYEIPQTVDCFEWGERIVDMPGVAEEREDVERAMWDRVKSYNKSK